MPHSSVLCKYWRALHLDCFGQNIDLQQFISVTKCYLNLLVLLAFQNAWVILHDFGIEPSIAGCCLLFHGVISQVNCILSWKPCVYSCLKIHALNYKGLGSSILFVCLRFFSKWLGSPRTGSGGTEMNQIMLVFLVCRHMKYQTEMQEVWEEQKLFRLFPSVPWQKQMGGWGNLPIWTQSQPPPWFGLQKPTCCYGNRMLIWSFQGKDVYRVFIESLK